MVATFTHPLATDVSGSWFETSRFVSTAKFSVPNLPGGNAKGYGARFGICSNSTIGTMSVGKGDIESQPLANRKLEI